MATDWEFTAATFSVGASGGPEKNHLFSHYTSCVYVHIIIVCIILYLLKPTTRPLHIATAYVVQ